MQVSRIARRAVPFYYSIGLNAQTLPTESAKRDVHRSSMPKRLVELNLMVVCFWLFTLTAAFGQVKNVGNDTSTPTPGIGHDYIRMLAETVNPGNGSVSLRIEVPTPKGRGISLPFAFAYDSNGIHHIEPTIPGQAIWKSNIGYLEQGGWSYSLPLVSAAQGELASPFEGEPPCDYTSNYVFQDPSGARHSLGVGATFYPTTSGIGSSCSYIFPTGGDAQLQASLDACWGCSNFSPPLRVSTSNGTVYTFSNPLRFRSTSDPNSYSSLADSIEDRNGNLISLSQAANGAFTFTDTLGRPAIQSSGFGPSGAINAISIFGLDSPYQITWKTTTANFSVPSTRINPSPYMGCGPFPSVTNDHQTVVSSITLPNGQQFRFFYGDDNPDPNFRNPYGLISEIDYPGGGWVKYQWKPSDQLSEFALFDADTGDGNPPAQYGCQFRYAPPVIATRQVSFDGANPVLTQTFVYTTHFGNGVAWDEKSTTVTNSDAVTGKNLQTIFSYSPDGGWTQPFDNSLIASEIPIEKTIQYYDGGADPIRTVNKTWYNDFDLASEETILDDGSTSKKTYCYVGRDCAPTLCVSCAWAVAVLSQLQEIDEYDFGQSTPVRKTVMTYGQAFPNTSIVDRPTAVVTYDGAGTAVAETDYAYDEGTIANAPVPAEWHDSARGTSFTVRGNLTTKVQKCFPSCSDAITKYTYDVTGQVLTMVDPDGNAPGAVADDHKTSYEYADQFSDGVQRNTNAYLTKITRPLGLTQSFWYDYNDGQLAKSRDENLLDTSYTYADSLRRLTTTDFPDGEQTSTTYDDTARTITTTKKVTSGVNMTSVSVMDGLGRVTQTQLTSDPEGTTFTDITYDGFGQVWKKTNPYRGGSTNDKTTFTYDALGRVKQIQQPDGSTVTTDYNGNCTTVTDEAGKKRRSCTDALGRLVRVEEPGATGAPPSAGTGSISLSGAEQPPVQVLVSPATSGSGSLQIGTGPVQWKSVSNASTGGTTSVTLNGTEQQYPAGVISGWVDLGISGTEQAAPAIFATGSMTFNGNEQSTQVLVQSAASGTATVSIAGYEQSYYYKPEPPPGCDPAVYIPCDQPGYDIYDSGAIYVTVNGYAIQGSYNQWATPENIAASFVTVINNDTNAPVWASSSGAVIYLTARSQGAWTNFSLSTSWNSWDPDHFGSGSFSATPSGPVLTGGRDAAYTQVYDQGTFTISIGGHGTPVSWNNGDTPNTIAAKTRDAVNADTGAVATATVASLATVSFAFKSAGASGNVSISCSTTYDTGHFGAPSFSCSPSGTALTLGRDPIYDSGTLSLTVNNHTTTPSTNWGFGSTPQTIAADLVSKVTADTSSFATAGTPNSNTTVRITAKTKGSISNYPYAVQVSDTVTAWPIAIFNTGVGSNGLPAADGAVDSHYTLVSSADASAAGPNTYISNSNAYPIGPWLVNGPNSKWIAPLSNAGAPLNPGTYKYRTTFDLSGLDRTTAVLQGRWGADDSGYIQLNGVTVPNSTISGFGSLTGFTINSGFVAGVNTLDFVVTNGGSSGNPTGVRIEISGSARRTLPSFAANPPGPANLAGGWPDANAVDHGTMTVTVNGHNYQVNWGQSDNGASIATNLVTALAADPSVNPSRSGAAVYINPKQAGTGYSFSTAYTYDTGNFTQSSFTTANQISDYGTLGISITGQSDIVPWAGFDTAATIATALRDKINADPAHKLLATIPGSIPADPTTVTLSITATASGAITNYTVTPSRNYDTAHFTSASFNVNPATAVAMSGGRDAIYNTVYDSGTISAYVNGFGTSVRYQQGSTVGSLLTPLISRFIDPASPVNISVAGSTINLTAKEPGGTSNYPIDISYSPDQPGLFPQNSFTISRSNPTLTGGAYQALDLSSPSVTLYSHDLLDNLTCVVQKGQDAVPFTDCASASANWRPRSFTYNSLSRLTSATNPESGTITYSYDLNGNVLRRTSPKPNQNDPNTKQTISYCYDTANRLTGKGYGAQSCPLTSPVATYVYDQTAYNGLTIGNPKGRRVGMSDVSGQTAWSVDLTPGAGWKTTEKRTISGVSKNIVTQNNLDGSVASITYPSNRVITYTPGAAGRPLEAKDTANGINYVTSATYAPFGGLKGLTNGSSITVSNDYNSRLQPSILSATAPGTTILSLSYDFHLGSGDNGNVYQIVNNRDGNRTQNLSYDELNRIQAAWTSGPNWGESFTIDALGNLTNRGPVAGKNNYEPLDAAPANTKNQLNGFGHDAAGNLTQNGSATYTYDEENRISSAGGVTYTYDGDGQRVKKSNGTLYWGEGPLAESDLSGNLQSEYVFFNGKRVARRDVSNNSVHYYFSDHLGSTSVITNSTGSMPPEQDVDYYPYGGLAQGPTADHYLFTGKERDPESGLDFFGARFYANQMGRWMSPDWSEAPQPVPYANLNNPQSLNLYIYVGNNPMGTADADGHCCSDWADAIDAHIDKAVNAIVAYDVASGDPERAANSAFYAGTLGDVGKGFANLLRLGSDMGSVGDHLSQGDYLGAANDIAQDGARLVGIAAIATGAFRGASPEGLPQTGPGENQAAVNGRAAHAEFFQKVDAKPGWQSQPSLKDPATGRTVKPDAVTKGGRPVELKPKTPSGRSTGQQQLKKYQRATGKKGRVVYYDPERYRKHKP
jgi:RHS repeat-associated protein